MDSEDPNVQWDILYTKAMDILSVMCPLKTYKQRENRKPWLTAEIYRVDLYNQTHHCRYLTMSKRLRNNINVLIDNAKSDFFKNTLNSNKKNPKKFWRIIKSFTDNTLDSNVIPNFKDLLTHDKIYLTF